MSDFKPIETQEEFDERIKDRLARERAKFDGYLSKDEVDALKTDYENKLNAYQGYTSPDDLATKENELKSQISNLTVENESLKLGQLKDKVSHEFGLPYELRNRLQGKNEDELKEDAENLSKIFKTNKKATLPLASDDPFAGNSKGAIDRAAKLKLLRQLKGD